jgi:hypothetical protein
LSFIRRSKSVSSFESPEHDAFATARAHLFECGERALGLLGLGAVRGENQLELRANTHATERADKESPSTQTCENS